MKPVADFSVTDWLSYLELRHTTEIKLGLARVKRVAKQLDLLKTTATSILVAGTNGKGSTISALEVIYTTAGYQVGAYTSPHLVHFNERIRVNQVAITDHDLIRAFSAIHACPHSEALTYFEMATLAALWHFKQNALDLILLEVGMGGRLDATNCIDADCAIITTIGLDHEAFLGNTTDAIAIEKAGIFRKNQPAIYADMNPPKSLLAIANQLQVKLFKLNQDYQVAYHNTQLNPKAFAAAKQATDILQHKLPVSTDVITHSAKTATIPGRQQWLNTLVPTLVDVAHNPQSVALLADYIASHPIQGKIHAVFSGLQDKKIADLMRLLHPHVHAWYLTTLTHPRAATAASLKAAYQQITNKTSPSIFNGPLMAYTAAVTAAKPGDVIVIYGSFLLVGEIMRTHLNQEKEAKHEFND